MLQKYARISKESKEREGDRLLKERKLKQICLEEKCTVIARQKKKNKEIAMLLQASEKLRILPTPELCLLHRHKM